MGLPCSSELAVLLAKEKGIPLSDKELKSVVDDAVENGLGPGGRPAKLLQHHRHHPLFKGLKAETIFLAIGSALGEFFSEMFFGYAVVPGPQCGSSHQATVWNRVAQ